MVKASYQSIGDALRYQALERPDSRAVITREHGPVSYRELDRRTSILAARLAGMGVCAGDRVAVLACNCQAMIEVMLATVRAGAIFLPMNWRLAKPEIAFILADATPAVLFVGSDLMSLVDEDCGVATLVMKEGTIADLPGPTGAYQPPAVGPEDIAMLVYTSGTTGTPKGAMLPHSSFARHWQLDSDALPRYLQVFPEDSMILPHPLFHIGTIEPVFRLLFNGGSIILHADFDPAAILADAQRYGVTLLGLVPTALQMVLRHPDIATADLSSIRQIFYGASPIPYPLLVEALETLQADLVQAYGMTEACGSCVMLPPDDHLPTSRRLQSAGKPIHGTEMKVVGADGVTLPPDAVGEILLRGSGLMTGYWNRPEATAETLDAEGWLHTGDAGRIDEDGYVYVQDRIKDMIISGGENIYPAEVESAVFSHPCVEEVAVVGVPDARWGEAVKAVVVPKAGHVVDEADVLGWVRRQIAGYKVPKSVDVVDHLPKSAAGKILRRDVKAVYWGGQQRMIN